MKQKKLCFILLLFTFFAQAQPNIDTMATYQDIDVKRQNAVLDILLKGDAEIKKNIANKALEMPNIWNPPVLYSLSYALFSLGRKDEATFWFYVGQLRARYDANRCKDESARQAVGILNENFGPSINDYALKDVEKLHQTVKEVILFVQENEEDYDHRWINLHGMGAILGPDESMSFPEEEWPAIKQKTIADYYAGFKKYVLKE